MEERNLDVVLVPLGLSVMACYHGWLLYAVLRSPKRTVIGLNAEARRRWIKAMMAEPMKNGVLAVQTLRNNIMASTVLATTAITLASLISVFVSATTAGSHTPTSSAASLLIYGSNSPVASSVKFFSIALCYIFAFLCNVQSIRHYAHVSFLVAVPTIEGSVGVPTDYVARSLNWGSYFWSLGLRAFYVSFTLFLWIFGPIPMLACGVIMCSLLYFLDTTTAYTRGLHDSSFTAKEDRGEA